MAKVTSGIEIGKGIFDLAKGFVKGLKKPGKNSNVKPNISKNNTNKPNVKNNKLLGKTVKTGAGVGALTYAGSKVYDLLKDAISSLLKGGDSNSSSAIAVRKSKNRNENTRIINHPISQNIIFKRHDYPNTYRVQLNQLSNEINYLIKRDKISQRKTDNKYQSIICRKILDKLTLHTEIQNDLIVNEIYNVLSADSEISETTKKNFINNIIDLITPKNKGDINASFINENTLKELKSINRTQTKIYLALKELSSNSLKNLKNKKSEHVQRPLIPMKSQNGATYVSGQNGNSGSFLKSLLGLLAGGALFSLFNPFGKDNEDENGENGETEEKEKSTFDEIKEYFHNLVVSSTPLARANNARAFSKNLREIPQGVKDVNKALSKAKKSGIRVLELGHKVSITKAQLSGVSDPAVVQRLEEKLRVNKDFLSKMREIFGERLGRVVKKFYRQILTKIGKTVLFGALQIVLIEYEQEHLDEILGRPATDEDRQTLYEISALECQPYKPLAIAVLILDLAPILLVMAGEILLLIKDLLRYISNEYKSKRYSSPVVRQIMADLGRTGQCILDALMIDGIDFVISLLSEAGKLLTLIDPNWLINKKAELERQLVKSAELIHVHSNYITDIFKDRGVISRKDLVSTGGIGDYKIDDIEALKDYSINDLTVLHDWEGLDASSKQEIENIINAKYRELNARINDITNAKNNEEKAWAIVNANIDNKIEKARQTVSRVTGALSEVPWEYENWTKRHTRDFFTTWKYYVNKIKDTVKTSSKKDLEYVLPSPQCLEMREASDIGGAGIYFIFFYGTVAVLRNGNEDALYNDNLRAVAILHTDLTFEFSDKPALDDKDCYEHYNRTSPLSWHDYKVKEYEKELSNLIALPESEKDTKNSTVSALTLKTYGTTAEALKYAPAVGSVKSTGADTTNIFDKVDVKDTSSGLSYLKSQFVSFGFNILFILENEMYGYYFKLLINNELTKSDEMPVVLWSSDCQTDFMGNCSKGGFFNKKSGFMPHPKIIGREYRFISGNGMYTYFSQSVDCSIEWFKHNLEILKKHVDFYALNYQFKTVIADIMYHAGASRFGTEAYKQLCDALKNKNFLTARNLIAMEIDQTDRGKAIKSRVERRVALLDTCNPKDESGVDVKSTKDTKDAKSTGGNVSPKADVTKETNNTELGGSLTSESLKYGFPVPVNSSTKDATAPTPEPVSKIISNNKAIICANNAIKCAKITQKNHNGKKYGHCAEAVRRSLMSAGISVPQKSQGRYPDAFEYHTLGALKKMGFNLVHQGLDGFKPQKGDICVINKFNGHEYGHISVFNGKRWVSDHVQDVEGKKRFPENPYKDTPNNGVYYYRYGGIPNQATPDPSTQSEIDLSEHPDYAPSASKQQSQQKTHQATAKNDTSGASKRANAVDGLLHKSKPVNQAETKEKPLTPQEKRKQQLDVYNTTKTNARNLNQYKLNDPNIFFMFDVLDYNDMSWALEK